MNSIPFEVDYSFFADDTAIFSSSNTTSRVRDRLQESIEGFEKWCALWKLVIQPNKTELIHFSPHPRKKYLNPIHLQASKTTIRPQSSARYLGVIFDQRLHWRDHIKHTETRVQSRINLLRAALSLLHFTLAIYIHRLTNIPYIRPYITELTGRALVRSQMMEDEVTEQNLTFLLDVQQ
ncbi:unnamed protein product [Rotaria sp. Silwood1]|nr:unnamed protein product [Rotaria sp. Silwood1]